MFNGVQELTLSIQDLCASTFIDDDLHGLGKGITIHTQYKLEYLATQILAKLRVPAQVLQDRKVVAEYPDGLWQHIRKTVGLKYRSHQVKLTEWLVFPSVPLEPYSRYAKNIRIATFLEPSVYDPAYKDEYKEGTSGY